MGSKNSRKDFYFRKAKLEGYRARSAFKLKEIQKKFKVFRKGDFVLDLGAAPGSWIQVAEEFVGREGFILGIDLKEIVPFDKENIVTIKGDITNKEVMEEIKNILKSRKKRKFNVVLSDASPNVSGIWDLDVFRAMELARSSLKIAKRFLDDRGVFVVKLFQGKEYQKFLKELKASFSIVKLFKPKASRKQSSEIYAICFKKKR